MVRNDDGRLACRELVAGDDDSGAVESLKNELDAGPAGPRDGAGEPISQEGVEGPQQEEQREEQVLDQQGECPGCDDRYAAKVGEQVAESACMCHLGAGSAGLGAGYRGRKGRRAPRHGTQGAGGQELCVQTGCAGEVDLLGRGIQGCRQRL